MNKKKAKIVLAIIAVIIITMMMFACNSLPKPLTYSDENFSLAEKIDGTYFGSCDNGLVKVQLEVNVQNHAIQDITLVEHQNGLGKAAEAVIVKVITQQSIEVDTISGATASSQTILKAVENALAQGN
jgi:uncharacterized protein with FMN-binding domain